MAEVSCPMCGRPNPAELETCRYCRAQLKAKSSPDENIPAPEDNNENSDWLGQLRDSSATEPGPTWEDGSSLENKQDAGEDEIPDWLMRVRERNQTENPLSDFSDDLFSIEDDAPSAQREELGDWLNSLGEVSNDQTPSANPDKKKIGWETSISATPTESSPRMKMQMMIG